MTVVDSFDPVAAVPAGARPLHRRVRTRAVRGWLAATAVYVTAVFHRSSLGVAGLDAADRFGVSAGALSIFVLLQLGVYAAMQVPTGILVDRFGPRRLLLSAAVTMTAAQLLFALTPTFTMALLARTLLGVGDAMVFVSLLRYATEHFAPRRYPVVIAVTGMLGALGNIVATIPLSAALASVGWTPSFLTAAMASAVAGGAVWLAIPRSEPDMVTGGSMRPADGYRVAAERVALRVREAWAAPGTRAGFWMHFATMSFTTMFGVLWGVPFLVSQGYSRSGASAMLGISVVAGLVSSPLVGFVFGRFRAARLPFALVVAFGTAIGWSVLLFGYGGRPPHQLLVVTIACTAVGAPASAIGFAIARDYSTPALVGTASGLVNVGGFSAAIVAAVGVGRVLDLAGSQDADAFRLAFAVAIAVQLFGGVQAVRWYRRLRASVLAAQSRGEPVPVPAVRHRWDLPLEPAAA